MQGWTTIVTVAFLANCLAIEGFSFPELYRPSTCYRRMGGKTFVDTNDVIEAIKESQGESCYSTIVPGYGLELRSKTVFKNETLWGSLASDISTYFCPSWGKSKECLSKHLSTNCRRAEVQNIKEALLFNMDLITSELACQQLDESNLVSLLEHAASGGLWDCATKPVFLNAYRVCISGHLGRHKGIPSFEIFLNVVLNQCTKVAVKACAEKQNINEKAMLSDLEAIVTAAQETHDSVWDGFQQ